MKKGGILNSQLMGALTELRHTDKLVICDAGFPVPAGSPLIDLSLVEGIPTMLQTLQAVLNEVIFEEYAVFDLLPELNPQYDDALRSLLKAQKSSYVTMPAFQDMAQDAKLYLRTGDLKPCANILLVSASGVPSICDKLNVVCGKQSVPIIQL